MGKTNGETKSNTKNNVIIPHLELIAPIVSVKIVAMFIRELDIVLTNKTFWTEAKVVLCYINHNVKKFKIFVVNRVQQINERGNSINGDTYPLT